MGKKEDPGNYRPISPSLIYWKDGFQEAISKCREKKVVTVSSHPRSKKGIPWLSSLIASTMKRLNGEGEKKGCFFDFK